MVAELESMPHFGVVLGSNPGTHTIRLTKNEFDAASRRVKELEI